MGGWEECWRLWAPRHHQLSLSLSLPLPRSLHHQHQLHHQYQHQPSTTPTSNLHVVNHNRPLIGRPVTGQTSIPRTTITAAATAHRPPPFQTILHPGAAFGGQSHGIHVSRAAFDYCKPTPAKPQTSKPPCFSSPSPPVFRSLAWGGTEAGLLKPEGVCKASAMESKTSTRGMYFLIPSFVGTPSCLQQIYIKPTTPSQRVGQSDKGPAPRRNHEKKKTCRGRMDSRTTDRPVETRRWYVSMLRLAYLVPGLSCLSGVAAGRSLGLPMGNPFIVTHTADHGARPHCTASP